jgi:cytochrome-b5 reductase
LQTLLSARSYATESPKKGSNAAAYAAAAALGVGGVGYYFLNTPAGAKAENKVKEEVNKVTSPAKKAFTGGDQGFVSLLLKDVQDINHNTKKFIFHLPEDDMVSGLAVASALLTKFVPEGEKAVLRPYTPTNDESAFPIFPAGVGLLRIRTLMG